MSSQFDVSIVLVNWNTRDRLIGALDSLVDDAPENMEIIVVDNASSDDSVAVSSVHRLKPKVIVRAENGGFSAGVNTGLAAAAGRRAVLLNSDARVRPGAIKSLVGYLDRNPGVGVVGGCIVHPDGRDQGTAFALPTLLNSWLEFGFLGLSQPLGMVAAPRVSGPVGWVSGAFMAFDRPWAIALGGFDERFFLYAEDIDFCRRVRQARRDVHFVAEAVAVHEMRGSDPVGGRWSPRAVAARLAYHRKHDGAVAAFLLQAALTLNWIGAGGFLALQCLVPGPIGSRAREREARIGALITRAGAPI
ncbi:MAG: glycosyltransferase [Candidatus Eisenbacteria bacterium]|nr:glycosyltransferase [Candidatus Eisenbacteria bacterium]